MGVIESGVSYAPRLVESPDSGFNTGAIVAQSMTPIVGIQSPSAMDMSVSMEVHIVPEQIKVESPLPLSFIPSSPERSLQLKASGPNLGMIAHEAGHALVGGIANVVYLDFNPDTDDQSLARVAFFSQVDASTAGAGAAMAGPFGTGGDQMTVAALNADWNTSVSTASSILSKNYSREELDTIVEITAYMSMISGGHIPGFLFGQIVERAKKEVRDNNSGFYPVDQKTLKESRAKWEQDMKEYYETPYPGNYYIDSVYENGDMKRDIVEDGKVVETHTFCFICKGRDGFHDMNIHQISQVQNMGVASASGDFEYKVTSPGLDFGVSPEQKTSPDQSSTIVYRRV